MVLVALYTVSKFDPFYTVCYIYLLPAIIILYKIINLTVISCCLKVHFSLLLGKFKNINNRKMNYCLTSIALALK